MRLASGSTIPSFSCSGDFDHSITHNDHYIHSDDGAIGHEAISNVVSIDNIQTVIVLNIVGFESADLVGGCSVRCAVSMFAHLVHR